MAEHIWTILSTKAVVDSHTNNLSLFDVLERITLSGPGPTQYKKGTTVLIPFSFSLITLWTRSDSKKPEKTKIRVTLFAPDKKSLFSHEPEIDLTKHQNRRVILNFKNFHLRGPGIYSYKVDMEKKGRKGNIWKNVANIPFEVIFDLEPKKSKTAKVLEIPIPV